MATTSRICRYMQQEQAVRAGGVEDNEGRSRSSGGGLVDLRVVGPPRFSSDIRAASCRISYTAHERVNNSYVASIYSSKSETVPD